MFALTAYRIAAFMGAFEVLNLVRTDRLYEPEGADGRALHVCVSIASTKPLITNETKQYGVTHEDA
jgi:hypothetical protein